MHQGDLASYFINGNGKPVAKSQQIVLNSYFRSCMIIFIIGCSFEIQCGATNSNGFCFCNSDISAGGKVFAFEIKKIS